MEVYIPNSINPIYGKEKIMDSDISLVRHLKNSSITLLWNLWELLITETPIIVIANTPAEASYYFIKHNIY